MDALRVLVGEDDLLVREGLVALLGRAPGVELCGAEADLDELLQAVDRLAPDVVVTDIRMPPRHQDEGLAAAHRLRRTHPEVAVLVLSQYVCPAYAMALLEGGSSRRGYLLKGRLAESGALLRAIAAVAGGGSYLDSEVTDALVRARTQRVDSPLSALTPREREILARLAEGAANAAIADALTISRNAVEKHINSIFAKLALDEPGTHRRVKAVLAYLAG